jgi:hypothetical protein
MEPSELFLLLLNIQDKNYYDEGMLVQTMLHCCCCLESADQFLERFHLDRVMTLQAKPNQGD